MEYRQWTLKKSLAKKLLKQINSGTQLDWIYFK